ncbi:MAG: M23 family metallopeptidase [bacterium]
MKKIILLSLFIFSCSEKNDMEYSPRNQDFPMKVTFSPTAVKSTDGKVNLVYSVEILKVDTAGFMMKDFRVFDPANDKVLCTIADTNKYLLIQKPANPPVPPEKFWYPLVDMHSSYRITICLVLDPAYIPQKLSHKLILVKNGQETVYTGAETKVSWNQPMVIAPPLRGTGWAATLTTSILPLNHHIAIQVSYKGNTTVPERYCVDWQKCNETGDRWHDDWAIKENWYCYGNHVFSATDGTVALAMDGMPDQSPVGSVSPGLSLFNGTGNCVVVFKEGLYIVYAHLIPGSVRVKTGDSVKAGDTIGQLGNSGNSVAPHLHFGVHSEFPYYISEGLPYYFNVFVKTGILALSGPEIIYIPLPVPEQHANEIAENFGVYTFGNR